MNKFTKASIATGAGIVLLLGGAGTLAYWNDSATTDAGTITAGTLTIDSNDDGAWFQSSNLDDEIDPNDFLVVPGDSLTYIESFEVGATGDNLEATVSANAASILKGEWGDQLVTTVTVLDDTTPTPAVISTVTSAYNERLITVRVVLDFAFDGDVSSPSTNEVDNDTQGEVVDLSALAITLTQVP
ncbi:alternate-type signal peptide domain-containing protein [Protaetiibacter intestinalis]|nr:alternate-type signal peptide domain-containing protein [Protaetiibacter intestinalis]